MCTKKVHHSTLLALPNTVWGIVVGLGGNAILWKTVATHRFTRKVLGRSGQWAFFGVGGILWIIRSLLTVAKVVTNFEFCCREWRCGLRIYFFNMMNVSLFMYAIAVPATLQESWRTARTAAFCVASLMQIGFNLDSSRCITGGCSARTRRWRARCRNICCPQSVGPSVAYWRRN